VEYLIPHTWFEGAHWALLLVYTAAATAVVVKGADLLVDGAAGIAYRMGMSKIIVGATIVSLGTTSPECAVSVMAAWRGDAGLALGNGIGSIIADTGLIFGLGCLLTRLPADRFVLQRQGWVQLGSAVLLSALILGAWWTMGDAAVLGRWVGILLLTLLAAYMVVSVRWSRQHPSGEPFIVENEEELRAAGAPAIPHSVDVAKQTSMLTLLGRGFVGLVLVIFASHVLIESVKELAVQWGVSKAVVAGTIVALGTSLPELVIGMTAIYKGHKELLVGNVIGADILNVLFVVGAAAAAKPLPVIEPAASFPAVVPLLLVPFMLGLVLLFRVFIFRAVRVGEFSRWMGIPLVAGWVIYCILGYTLST
jgi:cation:H+ antiporter